MFIKVDDADILDSCLVVNISFIDILVEKVARAMQ